MTLTIEKGKFYSNGKPIFLQSGEIHYFRIKRSLWDVHLAAARDAGLTTVSSYIPWAWHESEEGHFDFNGHSCPERDLEGWIQKCYDHGLQCILKPGPFILAEFRGAGLPDWFVEKHAEQVKMRTRDGSQVASDGVNLFHDIYLEKVTRWYDQVIPLLAAQQTHHGGPVAMLQVCNEIGVFSWLAHQADYGNGVQNRFADFLQKKYKSIELLNEVWHTQYADFQSVELPPDGRMPYASREDRAQDHDWHAFWRVYYGDYLRMLARMMRERGVMVPLYHNLPGWIYGNGYEFPVNITMYEDLFRDKSDILFGVDHIPEFQSYRNLHDDRIINDITSAMQGSERPLFAAEFQCGSREFHVETNPREMALFYKASVANGLKGWNFYMFSQGKNPPRKGYSGDTFYWFNPLTPDGKRTQAFELVQRISGLVKTAEKQIVGAVRKADIGVLFYAPYYASELERPVSQANELIFNPSAIRRPAYFDGLLKALQVLNVDYDMADLRHDTVDTLQKYKQLWVFSTDEMDAPEQQRLVDYVHNGGQLVVFPHLPDRQLNQQACTILRDAFGITQLKTESTDSALIDVYDLKDIKCANPQIVLEETSPGGAKVIARTIPGSACGVQKELGKGSFIFLGAWMGFDTEGHLPAYQALLNQSTAHQRKSYSSDYHVIVRERFTPDGQGMLFAGNYYNEDFKASLNYTHPQSGASIQMPFLGGEMNWPGMYGILTPLSMPLEADLSILHTTSDLIEVSHHQGYIELKLMGDRDLTGEIVFEGNGIHRLFQATVLNVQADLIVHHDRKVIHYAHPHQQVLSMKLFLNPKE